MKEAEKKAFKTFCSNTYFIDKYFGRPVIPVIKWEGSNLEAPSYVECLVYTSKDPELKEFSDWLDEFVSTELFVKLTDKYVEINIRLKTEDNRKVRHYLVTQASQLEKSL